MLLQKAHLAHSIQWRAGATTIHRPVMIIHQSSSTPPSGTYIKVRTHIIILYIGRYTCTAGMCPHAEAEAP